MRRTARMIPEARYALLADISSSKRRRRVALACLSIAVSNVATAQSLPSPSTSQAAAQDAVTLARLTYPEALNQAIIAYTIDHVVTLIYHADPELRRLEADHPGIIDAMIAAMRPELERGRREALPRLWTRTSAVFAAGLSIDDLRQAVAFYTSAAGRREMLAEQHAVVHASPPKGHPGARTSRPTSVRQGGSQASRTFEASAAGRKLAALRPQIAEIVSAWNSEATPEVDARVSQAMSKAADRLLSPALEPVRLIPLIGPRPTHRDPTD